MAGSADDGRSLLGGAGLGTVAFLISLAVFVGGAVMLALTIEAGVLLLFFGLGGLAVFKESATTDRAAEDTAERSKRDPLSVLRERYARGELTDEEFEHRLDRLLETEDNTDREGERVVERS